MLSVVLAGCATAPPGQQSPDAWSGAREIVGALPSLGLQKWMSLTPEQQEELVRAAEPFLLKWNAEGDHRALGVILTTFSAMWNVRTPAPAVHCTLLDHIVCF